MSPRVAQQSDADARLGILDAAEARFRNFGYRKTTMAEIADDCAMSAANIYRYFDSKLDIGAACAERCMGERVQRLRQLLDRPHPSAADALHAFVQESLEFTRHQACEQPRIAELVAEITAARQELVHAKVCEVQALLAELVERGRRSGEFAVENVPATAAALHSALVLFEVPIFVPLHSREFFESRARQVVELLLDGLRAR